MDYPPFPEAARLLEDFLRYCRVPAEVRWVGWPDVALVRGRIHIHPRPAAEALTAARAKYEKAVPRRLGVRLAALCRAGSVSYCYVSRPSSQLEAEYAQMPDGLKLSVPDPLPDGRVVTSDWEWDRLRTEPVDPRHKRCLLS